MHASLEKLRNGVVLAELGGYSDGLYCAKHGAGSALAVLGTYVVDASDEVPYPSDFVFRPGRASCQRYLWENIAAARQGGAAVGVSVVAVDVDDAVGFLVAAEEAGADFASWCVHSTMEWFTSRGLSSALLLRENWPRLRERLGAHMEALSKPLIVKLRASVSDDTIGAIDQLIAGGVEAVHANIGNATATEGLELVRRLSDRVPCLIVSGKIATTEDARLVIQAGADAVAIATAAMKDPQLCGRVQAGLRGA
jgi:tRNA-dihydrouridine synthase